MFSIIIPLFNKEAYIEHALRSVLLQNGCELEIIVVNDGSTDKSAEKVLKVKDPRIRLINQTNSGVSEARNVGIRNAKYKYIAFLDADDYWLPNFLQEIESLIKKFENCKIYATNYRIKEHKMINSGLKLDFDEIAGEINCFFKASKKNSLLTSSSTVIDSSILFNLDLFDCSLSHGEDTDFWIRLNAKSNIAFSKKELVIYNRDADNRSYSKAPNIDKTILFKYNFFQENKEANKYFHQLAYHFSIQYLLNGSMNSAIFCIKRLRPTTLYFYKALSFLIVPKKLRGYFYNTVLNLKR